jgi:SAM-dependent methyltransferase
MKVGIDETLRDLIPPPRPEERAALEASILAEGCRDPLVVWGETGVIVDGHNRFDICTQHGLPFQTREMHFADEAAAKEWMLTNQLGRRNLSEVDRIELHLAREDLRAVRRPGRPKGSSKLTPRGVNIEVASLNHHERSTDERVGKASGSSREKVRKHRRIKAVDPGLLDAIRDGKETYNSASRKVKVLEEMEARERRRRDAQERVEALTFDNRLDLKHGDFRELLLDLPDSSVDAIIADPPYSMEYIELWDALGEVAFRLLKDGGFLVAYAGNEKVCSKNARLERGGLREYDQVYIPMAKWQWLHYSRIGLKPILVLSKGTPRRPGNYRQVIPTGNKVDESAKEYHPWGQALEDVRYLLRMFSEPGELVLDPMAGSATTLIAAYLEGRRALGCEIDEGHYLEAKRKIVEQLR